MTKSITIHPITTPCSYPIAYYISYVIIYVIIIATCCLLSACSQMPSAPSTKAAFSRQHYYKLANDYIKKAVKETNLQGMQEYKLKAAEHFILAEEIVKAEQLVNTIEITEQEQEAYLYIIKAQIAMYKKQLSVARKSLQNIWAPNQLPQELQIKFYQARANLHLRTDNNLEAARDHILLEQFITDPAEKKIKNKEIWAILSKLTPNILQDKQQKHDDNFNGWLNLAHITKQYDTEPEQMARAITLWKRNHPAHPANCILPEQENLWQQNIIIEKPKHIALLLPLTGPHAVSAEIIRDGFLSAHYEHCKSSNCKTAVHIYDTTNNDAIQAYKNAINNKADFIVGPLIKDDVEKIANIAKNNTPILALNTTYTKNYPQYTNLFQFGLVPETEMTEIIEQAWHDGHRNVSIIVPVGDWGQRITTHFCANWQHRGGIVLAVEQIEPEADLNQKFRKLLAIDSSEQRIQNLKKITGLSFEAKPRRRQDIDAIIIATNPTLARQLKPLLNFYYAKDIPVYAHSSIYDGKTPAQNQDLNNITFCDMPWLLDHSIKSRSIYKNILKLWPDSLTKSPRLYAFGIDAYKITNQLHQLISFPDFGISGMTGILTLDKQQIIQRKLMWAKFSNGAPNLLATK